MSKDTPEYSFSGYGGTALHSRSAESTGCRCNRFVPPVAATAASSANGRDGSAISSFANVAAARRQSTVLRTSQVAIPSIFWLVLNLSCFGPSRAERWIGAGSDMPNRRNSCDWLRIWSGCCRGRATTRGRSMNYRRAWLEQNASACSPMYAGGGAGGFHQPAGALHSEGQGCRENQMGPARRLSGDSTS